jgi:heme A synthase
LARTLLALLIVQLVLGIAALTVRLDPELAPALVLALPAAHRLAGSLILAVAVMLAVRVWPATPHTSTLPKVVETTA